MDEIIYDEEGGQFNMDVLVTMEGTWERDMFYQAELINSGVRLYSKWPPIDKCYCYVSFWPGTGHCEIVANRVSETFIATLGVTTADEIEVAYRCGKAIYWNYDRTLYPLIGVPDNRNFAFQLPMQHGIVSILCTKNGWGSDIERYAHQYVEVSLPASGWDTDAKTQTVTVDGVSNTETDQMITPVPAVALVTYVVVPAIKDWRSNKLDEKQRDQLTFWVETAVLWANQWLQSKSGEEKKAEVMKFVMQKVEELNLPFSQDDVDKAIEAIYNSVKDISNAAAGKDEAVADTAE